MAKLRRLDAMVVQVAPTASMAPESATIWLVAGDGGGRDGGTGEAVGRAVRRPRRGNGDGGWGGVGRRGGVEGGAVAFASARHVCGGL